MNVAPLLEACFASRTASIPHPPLIKSPPPTLPAPSMLALEADSESGSDTEVCHLLLRSPFRII